jgi:hypothetical protein
MQDAQKEISPSVVEGPPAQTATSSRAGAIPRGSEALGGGLDMGAVLHQSKTSNPNNQNGVVAPVLLSGMRRGPWDERDEYQLFVAQRKYGNKWKKIAQAIGVRSNNMAKNRFYTIFRMVLHKIQKNDVTYGSKLELMEIYYVIMLAEAYYARLPAPTPRRGFRGLDFIYTLIGHVTKDQLKTYKSSLQAIAAHEGDLDQLWTTLAAVYQDPPTPVLGSENSPFPILPFIVHHNSPALVPPHVSTFLHRPRYSLQLPPPRPLTISAQPLGPGPAQFPVARSFPPWTLAFDPPMPEVAPPFLPLHTLSMVAPRPGAIPQSYGGEGLRWRFPLQAPSFNGPLSTTALRAPRCFPIGQPMAYNQIAYNSVYYLQGPSSPDPLSLMKL